MSSEVNNPTAASGNIKKTSAKKQPTKNSSNPPSHPKAYDMVLAAVTSLKERKGSSLQAIKKFISAQYKVDADKMAIYIRRALKKAVTEGALLQTKGSGASGSFKLPSSEKKTPSVVAASPRRKSSSSPKNKKNKKVSNNTTTTKKQTTNLASKKKKGAAAAAAAAAAATSNTAKTKNQQKLIKNKSNINVTTKSPKPKKAPSKPKAKKTTATASKK